MKKLSFIKLIVTALLFVFASCQEEVSPATKDKPGDGVDNQLGQ